MIEVGVASPIAQGHAMMSTDTPATSEDAEEIQSAADSLKAQFLAGATDKVTDAGEPEKE